MRLARCTSSAAVSSLWRPAASMKSWSGSSVPPDEARSDRPGRRRLGAHDDVALVERGAQRREVVLGELVLVGERLELLLLDETALGGLLDEALGRREVMQMNRVAQLNPFLGRERGRCGGGLLGVRCAAGRPAMSGSPYSDL